MFTGGAVQVIDSLLIPPTNYIKTTTAFNLTSFQGACYASKENSTFASQNMTIFAPTNDAFQALGPAITKMSVEDLASVMDYHLVPSVVYSTSLTNGSAFATQQGGKITVRHSGNNVYINGAQLLTRDILLLNGVLHVIDNVLNPTTPDLEPNPQLNTQIPAFASAVPVANLPFTSAIPCSNNCPAPSAIAGSATGNAKATAKSTGSLNTSSSKGAGAPVARETGFAAAGLLAALGGAVMMI
jgi:transforming growth factor-beta-induced protein